MIEIEEYSLKENKGTFIRDDHKEYDDFGDDWKEEDML